MIQDIILTLNELNIIFQELTMSLLEFDPAAYDRVRIAYQPQGQPAMKIIDDITYIAIFEKDHEYARPRPFEVIGITPDACVKQSMYTRVYEVKWSCYGPNSYTNARLIRDGLFFEYNREMLSRNNLFMVPDSVIPIRAPELFEAQWWERVDLTIRFNEAVSTNKSIPYIKTVPVTIVPEDKPDIFFEITENSEVHTEV
jgi:hypothetical protein